MLRHLGRARPHAHTQHEIDYILFIQVDKLDLKLNPEEVMDTKWVSYPEVPVRVN